MEATLPFYYSDNSMQKAFNFFLYEKVTKNQALHENWLKISSPAHAKKLGIPGSAKTDTVGWPQTVLASLAWLQEIFLTPFS